MEKVTAPKDSARLARSIERTLQKCEKVVECMQDFPRWKPDPVLVEKYHLIEFL